MFINILNVGPKLGLTGDTGINSLIRNTFLLISAEF